MLRFLPARVVPVVVVACSAWVGSCSEPGAVSDVDHIEVTPAALTMVIGEDSVVAARIWAPDGTLLQDRRVYWSSEDPPIATVTAEGNVAAVGPGVTQVAASSGGKSALVQVRVTAPPIALVQVSPASSGVGIGATLSLKAYALNAAGDTIPNAAASWRSSAPGVATVNNSGAVQGVAAGTANIIATIAGVSGASVVSVQPLGVSTITLAPTSANLLVGRNVQLTATLRAADNSVLTGRFIDWSSSAPGIATVSSTGLVTGLGTGSATITATSEGKRATASVNVSPVPVASVAVVPSSVTLASGKTAPLTALPLDDDGNVLSGRSVSWSTDRPLVATVDGSGVVTGIAPGTARITATSSGKNGVATVTVTLVPVATVKVTPPNATVQRGAAVQLQATVEDAAGNTLSGRSVTWSSGSSTIARVSSSGLVTGVNRGTVLIYADSEGKRGQATITVP